MVAATEGEPLPEPLAAVAVHAEAEKHLSGSPSGSSSPEWFGLNREMGEVRLGFYVGVGRLPVAESPVLNVRSRFEGLNYAAMFARCTADPVVSGRLDRTFFVWPEKDAVPVDWNDTDWFTRLLVYAFLNATAKLCARHLRRGSARVTENLQGRIKGRVLVGEQIRRNLSRLRPDRSVCSFSRFEIDTLENRILRAALEVGASYLDRKPFPSDKTLVPLTAASRAALAGVMVTRIHARDHLSARSTGTMAPYRTPLRLARAVLDHIGVDPENLYVAHEPQTIPPFALATSELFERYCEALLRKKHSNMEALVDRGDNLGNKLKVRPDYLVHSGGQGWIVDAKFKKDWRWTRAEHRSDVYQVVSYSRHRSVLAKLRGLGTPEETLPRIAVLYPALQGMQGWSGEQEFRDDNLPYERLDEYDVQLIRIPVSLPFSPATPEM